MATKVWRGTAVDIKQVDTATVSGTWTTGDTAFVSINGNQMTVTIGASTSVANVAEIMTNAINATSKTDTLQGDETRNFGGQQLPELTEVTASNTATEIVIEADTAGVPYTLTFDAPSTASTGNVVLVSSASATSKNFFDNDDNWSSGAAPVTGDTIIFQDSDIDCLYGLQQASVTNAAIQIDASYTGRIGLPPRNANGYDEYRQRHLAIKFASGTRKLVIGEGPGNGSARINIDPSTTAVEAVINFTATPEAGVKGAVDLIGGAAMTVKVRQGIVSLAANSSNSASVDILEMTYNSQPEDDAIVYVGDQATIAEIDKTGGQLYFIGGSGTVSTCTSREGYIELNGSTAVTLLELQGGTVRWNSTGGLGTCNLSGSGILDFSHDNTAKTVSTPVNKYSAESQLIDPNAVVGSLSVDLEHIDSMNGLQLGEHIRLTRSAL